MASSNLTFSSRLSTNKAFLFDNCDKFEMSAHKRYSIDAGYESMLSSTSFCSNNTHINAVSGMDTALFPSQPTTPVKSANIQFNSAKTPDHRQQFVADVDGMYLASIRSNRTEGASPIKSNFVNNFSYTASNSNSPVIKLPSSPKFHTDNFIHERDTFNSKLLRSPAFKLNPTCAYSSPSRVNASIPEQPYVVKPFSARFAINLSTFNSDTPAKPEPVKPPVQKTTPTEEEFMEILFKNRLVPNNPEFLIGRHMGLENIDILNELNKRSMYNVLDHLFSYLKPVDIVRVAGVSKDWRQIIKQNTKINRRRLAYIKNRKRIFETSKENRKGSINDLDTLTVDNRVKMDAMQKRILYRNSKSVAFQPSNGSVDRLYPLNTNIFTSVDVNCIDQKPYSHGLSSSVRDLNQNFEFMDHMDSITLMLSAKIDDQQKETISYSDHLPSRLQKANSLIDNTRYGAVKNGKRAESALNLVESSPKFIAKNLKLSPNKLKLDELSIGTPAIQQTNKIDLIGSKKSKKILNVCNLII